MEVRVASRASQRVLPGLQDVPQRPQEPLASAQVFNTNPDVVNSKHQVVEGGPWGRRKGAPWANPVP